MPAWVSAYFAVYITFTFWSLTDDIKNKKGAWWSITAEIVSDLCLLLAAFSFWLSSFRAVVEQALLAFFALGFVLFVIHASLVFRRQVIADTELSLQGKLFVGFSGTALVLLFSGPLLWWGFSASVRGSYAGT